MRAAVLLILLTRAAVAQDAQLAHDATTGTIEGTVLSGDGSPLAGATVYALPRHSTYVGRLLPVKTDELGRFRLTSVKPGETVIYAYDLEEGYLDPHAAFNSGNKFLAVVTVVSGGTVSAEVRLGPKCAYLFGTVQSSQNGAPVRAASFKLSRADDPNIWLSTAPVDDSGHFRLGVPSATPIDLQVDAERFSPWRPDARQAQALKAGLKAGEEYELEIQLKPSPR
jgi:hypothetical protein